MGAGVHVSFHRAYLWYFYVLNMAAAPGGEGVGADLRGREGAGCNGLSQKVPSKITGY